MRSQNLSANPTPSLHTVTSLQSTNTTLSLAEEHEAIAPRSNRAGTAIVFLVVFVDLLGFGLVLPLLPVYGEHLMTGYSSSARATLLGILMTSFSLMQFLFSPLWGRLSDRIGRRPVLIIGLVGSTMCYTLFGFACRWASLPLMFAARVGAGIMGATIATAQAYIADVTPPQRRAGGMALIGAAFGLGFTFGPLLGALVLSSLPSREAALSPWPGFLGAGFSATALVLAVCFLKESLPRGLNGTPANVDEFARPIHNDWHLLFDKRSWREVFLNPRLALLLLIGFLIVFALSGFEGTLSVTLADLWQQGAHRSPAELTRYILWVFVVIGLIQSLTQGLLVRRLSRRLAETTLALTGLVIGLGGFLLIAWAVEAPAGVSLCPYAAPHVAGHVVVLASGIVAAGMAFVLPGIQSLISRHADAANQGWVFGLANSLSAVGRILGVLVAFEVRVLTPAAPFWLAVVLLLISVGLLIRSASPLATHALQEQR